MSFSGQANQPWQRNNLGNVLQAQMAGNNAAVGQMPFHVSQSAANPMFLQQQQQQQQNLGYNHAAIPGAGGGSGGGMYQQQHGSGASISYPQSRGLNPVAFQNSPGQHAAQSRSQQHYNSIGTVTKINADCGLVNDEIFFYRNVCKGAAPKLGDRVLFEATFSTSGQFKWNATRVQLMPPAGGVVNAGHPPPLMGGGGKGSGYSAVPPPNEYLRAQQLLQQQRRGAAASPRRAASPPSSGRERHSRNEREQRRERDRSQRSRDKDDDEHDRKRRRGDDVAERSKERTRSSNAVSRSERSDRERERERDTDGKREVEQSSERRDRERGDRERERGDREREREREKERERSPLAHRTGAKSRRTRTIRRYTVQIPKSLLTYKHADVQELRQRYATLYIPSDFFQADIKWSTTFTHDNPFSLRRPCQFHIMHKIVEPLQAIAEENAEPTDVDYLYSAKVMLLACPPIAEMYQKCFEDDDNDSNEQHTVHPSRLISFLVGTRGRNEPMAIGGPWSPSLDGANPDKDPAVLIRTAIRTCKALTGIDLSNCTQWYRFVELYYHRTDHKSKDRDAPPRIETVVIYLPDIHSCLATTGEWEQMTQGYKAAVDAIISSKMSKLASDSTADAAATLANDFDAEAEAEADGDAETEAVPEMVVDEDEECVAVDEGVVADADAENNEDVATMDTSVDAEAEPEANDELPEPSHFSELDLKSMKVAEIRTELQARNLPTKASDYVHNFSNTSLKNAKSTIRTLKKKTELTKAEKERLRRALKRVAQNEQSRKDSADPPESISNTESSSDDVPSKKISIDTFRNAKSSIRRLEKKEQLLEMEKNRLLRAKSIVKEYEEQLKQEDLPNLPAWLKNAIRHIEELQNKEELTKKEQRCLQRAEKTIEKYEKTNSKLKNDLSPELDMIESTNSSIPAGVRNLLMARLAKALNAEKSAEKNAHKQKIQRALKKVELKEPEVIICESDDETAATVAADEPATTNDEDGADADTKADEADGEEQDDWADVDMNDIVILDEYDSMKNPEDAPKEFDEKEKNHLLRRYTLPSKPQIIVHPSKTAKGGKFDCSVMSLSVLLDYRQEDTKERFFEVSLFAELFNEMLMRDFGFNIYKELFLQKEINAVAAAESEAAPDATNKKDDDKTKDSSSVDSSNQAAATESTNEKSKERRTSKHSNDVEEDNQSVDRKRRNAASSADKKMMVVKPQLLLSFTYFDTTHCGYIFEKDLEDLFAILGLNLSRGQIRKVLGKSGTRQAFYYRKLTDKEETLDAPPSIEETDDLSADDLRKIALGNKQYYPIFKQSGDDAAAEVTTVATTSGAESDGLINYNGTLIHVGKLMEQIKRTERKYSDQEKLYGDLRKQYAELQKEHTRSSGKVKELQSEVKSLNRKISDTDQDLYTLNRKYKDQNSTLSYVYNRVSPYFKEHRDKDHKSESTRDKDNDKHKEKEKDADKAKDNKHKEKTAKDDDKDKKSSNNSSDKEKNAETDAAADKDAVDKAETVVIDDNSVENANDENSTNEAAEE